MSSWFIRHWPKPAQWTATENKNTHGYLFKKHWIAIHFESITDWEPDAYSTRAGKSAIRLLNELRKEGGTVCVDYPAIGEMYVGEVKKGQLQNSFRSNLSSERPILKYLKLHKPRKVSGHARTFFRTLSGQGTIKHWPSLHGVLPYFYKHGKLPRVRVALLPAQLETICQEYLRDNQGMLRLLWPIGRSMPDIDIVGINKKGGNIYAQVTHADTKLKLKPKLDRLLSFKDKGICVFFCPQSDDSSAMQEKYLSIKFIWTEEKVWKWLQQRKNTKYMNSLLSWLS
jgi:hypothetical protein